VTSTFLPTLVGRRTAAALLAGLFAAALPLALSAQVAPPLAAGVSPVSEGTATFDEAWRAIRETYVDESISESDWDALRGEFRPRAATAASPDDVRDVLRGLLARIGRSHFELVPSVVHERMSARTAGAPGSTGFEVTPIAGDAVVSRVDLSGPAAAAGVKPGWILDAIGPDELRSFTAGSRTADRMGEFRLWAATHALLRGDAGSTVRLRLRDLEGRTREIEVSRAKEPGEPVTLGHLPTFVARLEASWATAPAGGRVRIVSFNVWMVPLAVEIDRVLFESRDASGTVLDLRHNPGGVLSMLMGLSGHFVDGPTSLGTLKTRDSELKLLANPRLVAPDGRRTGVFGGRLAILVDETSYSASEIFAAGMQSIGRARIFGSQTPGGALPAMMRRLPNGDVLEYAIGDFVTAGGRRVEGTGVSPDVAVPVTREDLAGGRDRVLETAVEWAGGGPPGGDR
jgi:carboxyl-terminal processing protease